MDGVFYARSELTDPWAIAMPPIPNCLMFHVVTAGRCWLEDDAGDPVRLEPGVFALIPHGEGHRLSCTPGQPAVDLFDIPREEIGEHYEVIRHGGDPGGGGQSTQLICGAVRFEHPAARRLASFLPRRMVIESWTAPQSAWIRSTLHLMAEEARAMQPGGETLITRLADILVIQAIRTWIAEDPAARTGWLGALQDPQIGRALQQIHRDPAAAWSVASLAAAASMSRSAFAARFAALVGESPMQYVARHRMQQAVTWLREETTPMAEIARRLGYCSEAAFSRAFKRVIGQSPGAVRRAGVRGPIADEPRTMAGPDA
jgi:AraC-like DNA-binding protein